uniref:SET domain-containing protein n=1 Tax=Chrysotila carterae TaxID=13221 RepID=A0A7S4FA60_CHRCT
MLSEQSRMKQGSRLPAHSAGCRRLQSSCSHRYPILLSVLHLCTSFQQIHALHGVQDPYLALHIARMNIAANTAGVRIAPSPGKGMGVFALRQHTQEFVVGEYAGEFLSQRDIDARYENPLRTPGLWTPEDEWWYENRVKRGVGCTGAYIFKVDDDLYIDGEDCDTANWTRFLNHGEPNLRVKSLAKGLDGKPRVWFVALRDIEAGEELLWDYGESYWKEDDVVV